MAFNDPIYFIKATKVCSTDDVYKLLHRIFGEDSIDRLLSIDGKSNRVFIVAFWRVPLVNQFHDVYTEPTDSIHGIQLPWSLELMDPYMIFSDGHYPAPHFLRNSKNLTDEELDDLGIGGPGEFIYTKLPKKEQCDSYWEMYRDGKFYMPDLSHYNQPRLEPLGAIDKPSMLPSFNRTLCSSIPRMIDFERWRDFYIEHPASWPKDLTHEERAQLEQEHASICIEKSHWMPECGDPTAMVEKEEMLAQLPQRSITSHNYEASLPQRTLTSHKYRSFG